MNPRETEPTKRARKGFSLVEMIAVLMIVGIVTAIGGLGLTRITQGYLLGKANVDNLQNAELVMNRVLKEWIQIGNAATIQSGGNGLLFPRNGGVLFEWDGNAGGTLSLTISGVTKTLCTGVSNFNAAAQADGSIRVSLALASAPSIVYAINLFPR